MAFGQVRVSWVSWASKGLRSGLESYFSAHLIEQKVTSGSLILSNKQKYFFMHLLGPSGGYGPRLLKDYLECLEINRDQ
jgi:hypothetical protein